MVASFATWHRGPLFRCGTARYTTPLRVARLLLLVATLCLASARLEIMCFGASMFGLSSCCWCPTRTTCLPNLRRSAQACGSNRIGSLAIFASEAKVGASGPVTWESVEVGQSVQGTIKHRWFPAGYFVNLSPGVDGFLEVGEFRNGFPEGWPYLETQKVAVRILSKTADRIYLTMRSGPLDRPDKMIRTPNPDVSQFLTLGAQEWLKGEVIDMSAFAVYVKVADPSSGEAVKGMIHKSEFKQGFADHVAPGDTVRVRVTLVETAKRRVAFSMLKPA